jgi:hypothetical protein
LKRIIAADVTGAYMTLHFDDDTTLIYNARSNGESTFGLCDNGSGDEI